MSIIVQLKRLIRKDKGCFEVWDTSAISNWFELLTERVEAKGKNKIVLPEGVVQEISDGRKHYVSCRVRFDYITKLKSKNVVKYPTPSDIRLWKVDEQVVEIAYRYFKEGYEVKIVTCDRGMAYAAEIKGISVELLEGKSPEERVDDIDKKVNVTVPIIIKKPEVPSYKVVSPQKIIKEKNTPPPEKLFVEYTKVGKQMYISVSEKIEVYDNKGKRKIGKQEKIPITLLDKFIYKNNRYEVQSVNKEHIVLELIKN